MKWNNIRIEYAQKRPDSKPPIFVFLGLEVELGLVLDGFVVILEMEARVDVIPFTKDVAGVFVIF